MCIRDSKNLETGNKLNERFRSEDKVERVTLEQKDFSYLFDNGDSLVFMDDATYEQIELQKGWVGDERIPYLQEGMKVIIEMHEDRPIGLEPVSYTHLDVYKRQQQNGEGLQVINRRRRDQIQLTGRTGRKRSLTGHAPALPVPAPGVNVADPCERFALALINAIASHSQ